MFSIGLLGFIVWSQKVALPYCEIWKINLAICWNSLVLIGTLDSKNSFSYTQSAGNLYTKGLRSSSETIRETSRNFELFNNLEKRLDSKDSDLIELFKKIKEKILSYENKELLCSLKLKKENKKLKI